MGGKTEFMGLQFATVRLEKRFSTIAGGGVHVVV